MLNAQQIALLGVYGAAKPVVTTFYLRRILSNKMPYITNMETIAYEEIEKYVRQAHILRRGDKFPVTMLNGSVIKSVTPEVLKDSVPFKAGDMLNRQPGQYVFINGMKVDNRQYEQDRRVEKLKVSLLTAKEAISASVFLKGTYMSKQTNNKVTYTYPTAKTVTKATLEKFEKWLIDEMNDFVKTTNAPVTEILIGANIFNFLRELYNPSSNEIMGKAQITINKAEDGQEEMSIKVMGKTFTLFGPAYDVKGDPINTDDEIMFYNTAAFLPAYAGVVNVLNGVSMMEAVTELLRELPADPETGESKTLIESSYCPIIVNSGYIKTYKVTGL